MVFSIWIFNDANHHGIQDSVDGTWQFVVVHKPDSHDSNAFLCGKCVHPIDFEYTYKISYNRLDEVLTLGYKVLHESREGQADYDEPEYGEPEYDDVV